MSRSLVPTFFNRDWWSGYDYPPRLLDQHFGLGLTDDDLFPPTLYRGMVIRPRRQTSRQVSNSGVSEIVNTSDKFQVSLDVSHFSPEDITVKTVDNCLMVHAKHEEKVDQHGFVSREFTRKYILPKEVVPESVVSSLSPDGVLTIEAPKHSQQLPSNERLVPITKKEASALPKE
ncbi:protein lethal(2)essential for life-like [Centruroides vittatus]|uniref:protein lethal(2)essential for life-like n=1 Tax=Centruroides vittatus TaxID=120091 RepID=UPI00350F0B1F